MPSFLTPEERARAAAARLLYPAPRYRYHYRIGAGGGARMLVEAPDGTLAATVELSTPPAPAPPPRLDAKQTGK